MKAKVLHLYILVTLCAILSQCSGKVNPIEEFTDPKMFKQLLRTRTNVMVLFMQSKNAANSIYRIYKEAAVEVRGIGTMITVDCSGPGQKLCRQLKAVPEPYAMNHYKDGKFHKVYDRQETAKSLIRFMNDPTGDVPWEEEPTGKHVVHLEGPSSIAKVLKKHKRVLVMFYAPWCIYCKQLKPEYAAAAEKVRASGLGVLAAMDVVRTGNAAMRTKYNITGFPTVHYFQNGVVVATYEGENNQDKIVEFMKDPTAVSANTKEVPWSEEQSNVHHLITDNFDEFIKNNPSTLVMFYAPWCGHCKNLKPEWTKASSSVKQKNINGIVAAVDATKETTLTERFKIKSFPTIKYFKKGEYAFDTPNLRDMKKIVDFLQDPKEPPPPPPPEPNWADIPSEVIHLTGENFKSLLRSKRHALVMFYAPWCGHCKTAKPEFEAAAEQLKEESRMVLAAVNCVDNPAVCKQYDVKGYPTFMYFKYYKEAINYNSGRMAEDFVKFLTNMDPDSSRKSSTVEDRAPSKTITSARKEPIEGNKYEDDGSNYPGWDKILYLTDKNYKTVLSEHKHLIVVFYKKGCDRCKDMKRVLAEIALNHDSSIGTLAACDIEKSLSMMRNFDIKTLPLFKYIQQGKSVMDYTGEWKTTGLKEFIRKIKTIRKDEL